APVQTFFSTSNPGIITTARTNTKIPKVEGIGFHSYNLRCMETAIKLNTAIRSRSCQSELVFITLPEPKHGVSDEFYMEFIEALTEGLGQVVLVKGTEKEVVTIYS
ncbi:unnamed protein product, partial [Soboliphyme baturini]|uniref:SLC12 domain-containing protein n=1 Tax=Soboliphyme baturini TaxID=241478 RepID=A0A183IPM9_9BILA